MTGRTNGLKVNVACDQRHGGKGSHGALVTSFIDSQKR
jgi:hypothetical protein